MKAHKDIEKLLSLIPLSLEEKRVLQILLSHQKEGLTARQLRELYERGYNLKIGNKIYFVLNNLYRRNLISMDSKTKKYSCDVDSLSFNISLFIHNEYKTKIFVFNELSKAMSQPIISTYSDSDVLHGFFEMEKDLLREGGTFLDIRDILPYTADLPETLEVRRKEYGSTEPSSYSNLDSYRLIRRHELLKEGRLLQIMILDKIATEQTIRYWLGTYGYSYVMNRLNKFLEILQLPNYQIVFSKQRVNFMLEIIPGHATALYYRSRPFGITDRLVIFWGGNITASFEKYFWEEYNRTLKGKDEKEAKEEVIKWTKGLINLLTEGVRII